MKKTGYVPMVAFVIAFAVLGLAACGAQEAPTLSSDLVQVMDGATTRGGYTVSGPVSGGSHGWAYGAYYGDIGEVGYIEEEYFIEGSAQRYTPIGELGEDGNWTIEAVNTAAYKTRFIVRRPADPANFNGTVVIEWANVSGGFEMSFMDSPGLYAEGFAYVAASVQYNGLYGYPGDTEGLTTWDSERYGDLSIADDALSFDIFTQIARAVGKGRHTDGIDPMGGLVVDKVFGVGESQSGSRVLSYANGVQPIENVFDALVTVVCGGKGTDFAPELAHYRKDGKTEGRTISARAREDINCKVFIINSQTESNALGRLEQPDTSNIVSWQVAGASHLAPQRMESVLLQNQRDGTIGYSVGGEPKMLKPVDWTNVYEAALVRIQEWIDSGIQPSAVSPMSSINMLFGYWLDNDGNAKGGVRLPELSVPIATYDISILAGLNGQVTAFNQEEILALYPTHQDYIDKIAEEANNAVALGIILPYRAGEYLEEAQAGWIASIWTNEPMIELIGSGNSFNLILFVFICICTVVVGVIVLITVRIVRKRAKRG
jgi:hypothetical protein